jgi:prophage tail gpP-like protein
LLAGLKAIEMPKTTTDEIITGLVIRPEMFYKQTEQTFPAFVNEVITEQAELLEGRVGSVAYADTTKPRATYIKRAEKCMVAAELLKRRRNHIIAQAKANGEEVKTVSLDAQIRDYSAEAEVWIAKVATGVTTDGGGFATGTLVTDHFGGQNA